MNKTKTILLGIGGGIAVYKSCDLVRLLRERGYAVRVVMTRAAQEFVRPMTFQALSQNPVHTELFDLTQESQMGHIHLADTVDLICVAPATADLLARLAHGHADDLLATLVLVSRAPKLLAPSMNVHMWENPATKANVAILRERGFGVLEPDAGLLACGYEGRGRLPEVLSIADAIDAALSGAASDQKPLAGKRVLVTAGPTREFLDPFRFLSNPSSGKMGIAFAEAALAMGAAVDLALGPTLVPPPAGVSLHRFESAEDLLALAQRLAPAADMVVMAAAVSDYTFGEGERREKKLKKMKGQGLSLSLQPTPDILKALSGLKKRPYLVGFAAETDHLEDYALKKLKEKGCDAILANRIGGPQGGFESDSNTLWVFEPGEKPHTVGPMSKKALAKDVLALLSRRLPRKS